jgi:hypothetical protein
MMGSNLNHLVPDYRNKRKEKKNLKEINFWQQKINQQLELYHLEDDNYDTQLGNAKKKTIVMNCCLNFFDDNVPLLESIIENELEHIKKSGFVMRVLLAKIEIFFCKSLEITKTIILQLFIAVKIAELLSSLVSAKIASYIVPLLLIAL